MGQLRTAKAVDVAAFPGAKFVVEGTPPDAQCQEASVDNIGCSVETGLNTVTKIGGFAGYDLTGKDLDTDQAPPNNGPFTVLSNTDDVVIVDHLFTVTSGAFTTDIFDPGQPTLTRSASSFARFAESQGQAHTTKGGQMYTDTPDPPMDDACSFAFDPQ